MRIPRAGVIGIFIAMVSTGAQDGRITVLGTVLDPLGIGIPHVGADLQSEASHERIAQSKTDDSGVYRFFSVPPGEYALKLQAAGFAQLAVRSIEVSDSQQTLLPPIALSVSQIADCGGHAILEELRVLPASKLGVLRGSVWLDQYLKRGERAPVGDAVVTLICKSGSVCGTTKTDSLGDFVFSNLSAATFTIRISPSGFYQFDEPGYAVQVGYAAAYRPILIERCPAGDCDPRRRRKKPPARCE